MDVDAGAEPPPDQGLSSLLRLDNGRIGRIDEHRAFHIDLLPRPRAAAPGFFVAPQTLRSDAAAPSRNPLQAQRLCRERHPVGAKGAAAPGTPLRRRLA